MRKPKFRPEITRVKLNPEQAVLQCSCFFVGQRFSLTTYLSNVAEYTTLCWTPNRKSVQGWRVCDRDDGVFGIAYVPVEELASS